MRCPRALAAGTAILVTALGGNAVAQEPELARAGVGLLPPPAQPPAALAGTAVEHPFLPDPAGGFSRVVFESSDAPDFKVVIREYSFPADQPTRALALSAGALVHVLSGEGEVRAGDARLALNAAARAITPPGTTLSVVNTGQQPVTLRVLTVEPK